MYNVDWVRGSDRHRSQFYRDTDEPTRNIVLGFKSSNIRTLAAEQLNSILPPFGADIQPEPIPAILYVRVLF